MKGRAGAFAAGVTKGCHGLQVMLEAENLILVPGTDSIDQWVVQMRGQLAKSPAIIIAPLRTCKDHLLGACAWEIQVAA